LEARRERLFALLVFFLGTAIAGSSCSGDRSRIVAAVHIWHLAVAAEWDEALAGGGPYLRSTLGKSLAEVGFIHCSFEDQVAGTAQLIYPGRADLVLLTVETDRLDAEVIVEDGFPHIYGELPLGAVVDSRPYSTVVGS
jgi:uncharacterized protein (DUF952 family)